MRPTIHFLYTTSPFQQEKKAIRNLLPDDPVSHDEISARSFLFDVITSDPPLNCMSR